MENRPLPRRNYLDLLTPAEMAIQQAAVAVESAGTDPRLTEAINLLHQARRKVADYVDRAVVAVSPDVARLVVAARKVAFEDRGADAILELDQASEAFAAIVPWEDSPAITNGEF